GPEAATQFMAASLSSSTPPGTAMRCCALLEAPPGPQGEAAKSSTTPTTSVAAPNPWTVPVPVRISSTIPWPGVTDTSLSVKVALSMLLAGEPTAPRADWAGAADAVSEACRAKTP